MITQIINEKQIENLSSEESFIHEKVTADDIAAVVSKSTGIPVQSMLTKEKEKLITIEKELSSCQNIVSFVNSGKSEGFPGVWAGIFTLPSYISL